VAHANSDGATVSPVKMMARVAGAIQGSNRAFAAAQSLLFELLLGYQSVDVAHRGRDPERDATLTLAAMEHLIAVVRAVDLFGGRGVAFAEACLVGRQVPWSCRDCW
jgi:hypothetical protein